MTEMYGGGLAVPEPDQIDEVKDEIAACRSRDKIALAVFPAMITGSDYGPVGMARAANQAYEFAELFMAESRRRRKPLMDKLAALRAEQKV